MTRWGVDMARQLTPLTKRVLDKFEVGAEGCWEWVASLDGNGYGQINEGGRGRPLPAHRVVYEMVRGPIPEGLYVDHLCRNPRCVKPSHLEPVTHAENVRRGRAGLRRSLQTAAMTHCKWGHEFTPENTYVGRNANGNPRRVCRRCRADRQLQYNKRGPHVHVG